VVLPAFNQVDAYVVNLGEATNIEALKVVQAIRNAGFSADRDVMNRKAKAQFKTADKEAATLVFTLGEDELAAGMINVKAMATREEKRVSLTDIYESFTTIYDEMTKGE
jgi:histidyl-tRNA synthetase